MENHERGVVRPEDYAARGRVSRTVCAAHTLGEDDSWGGGGGSSFAPPSLLRPEAGPPHPLVEEQVGVGGQRLLQAGPAHRVVRHPQPLRAEGGGASRRGRAAAVRDEMSRVHVAVVHQDGREPEQVSGGAVGR